MLTQLALSADLIAIAGAIYTYLSLSTQLLEDASKHA